MSKWVIIPVAVLSSQTAQPAAVNQQKQCVMLLHGLWRTSSSMKALQWYLEGSGYATANQSYPSLTYSIEVLAELEDKPIAGLPRVVMLGPPNTGSQLADYNILSLEFLQPVAPAAVAQLGTGADSLPLRLGKPDFELGVIAGSLRQSTLLPGFPDEVNDGTVALSEIPVYGMKDFLELPVSHTFMMCNPKVLAQIVYFLMYGEFDRSAE